MVVAAEERFDLFARLDDGNQGVRESGRHGSGWSRIERVKASRLHLHCSARCRSLTFGSADRLRIVTLARTDSFSGHVNNGCEQSLARQVWFLPAVFD